MRFFQYLESSTQQEKDEVEFSLKTMYNQLLEDENERFMQVFLFGSIPNDAYYKARENHRESVGKLAAIQGVFEILHIPYEAGVRFDDVTKQ